VIRCVHVFFNSFVTGPSLVLKRRTGGSEYSLASLAVWAGNIDFRGARSRGILSQIFLCMKATLIDGDFIWPKNKINLAVLP
jgi:hypothetical protein